MRTWRELESEKAADAAERAPVEQLRRIAIMAAEALEAVDNWLGAAGSRTLAAEALWRLRRGLSGIGIRVSMKDLGWRQSVIEQLERAGWRVGFDGRIRRVLRGQRSHEPAQGQALNDATSELDALRDVVRIWEIEPPHEN